MPEATQQQTNIVDAKADDECEHGTVIFWNGRFGWARRDGGGADIYLGIPQLERAGIARLEIGFRLRFEVRKSTHGRKPWAARIRLASEAPA
jgi:cold shock CspA family protein